MSNFGNIDKIIDVVKLDAKQFFFIPWIGKKYEKGLFGKKILVVGASHYCLHTNECYRPTDNEDCPSFAVWGCMKGCKYFKDCTISHTKNYNDNCEWMKDEHSCLYDELCRLIDAKIENDDKKISKRLNSTTLDEVCNFLDPSYPSNVSFSKFTSYLFSYIKKSLQKECYKNDSDIHVKEIIWERIAFANYAQNFQPNSTGNDFQPDDFAAFESLINVLKPNIVIVWGCDLRNALKGNGFVSKDKEDDYILCNKNYSDIIFLNSYHPSYSRFKDGGRLEEAMDTVFK